MATTTQQGAATAQSVGGGIEFVDVDRVALAGNVRELDAEHVENLAASIKLRGLRVPIIVQATDDGYELVAGYHRLAAHQRLGLSQIRADVQSGVQEAADRGLENIARKQLRVDEEAEAVRAMLADGLTADGAAQALAWSKAKVTARMRLLELPERARVMVGRGEIPLSAVEELRTIKQASSALLDVLLDYAARDDYAAGLLGRDTVRVLGQALRESDGKVFAASLSRMEREEPQALRLGKKAEEAYARANELATQLDRYAYGVTVRFAEAEVDQARAAGALLALPGGAPLVVDRGVYRELCKQAIHRTVAELEARIEQRAEERKADRAQRAEERLSDPEREQRREEQRHVRELAEQAHGVNLDLGTGLLHGLSTVDPADMSVARFFAYALLGSDHDGSAYTQSGQRVAHLASCGIRLVIEEFRADLTKTRKDGTVGALRIDYGDPSDPSPALKWMWKYVDGARTAGELYGRALVVIAAERYACRLVVPQAQRGAQTHWGSHHDRAEKALDRLAGPHLPASLKRLEKAIAEVHRAGSAPAEPIPAAAANTKDNGVDEPEV